MSAIPQSQKLNDLLAAPPVGTICIDGAEYRLGQLGDEFFDAYTQFGFDVLAGKPVTIDPHREIRALLAAGNPALSWDHVKPRISRENCFTAIYEVLRQAAHWGVAKARSAGSA